MDEVTLGRNSEAFLKHKTSKLQTYPCAKMPNLIQSFQSFPFLEDLESC